MTADGIFRFRLYVAGNAPNSRRAIGNLRRYCREKLRDRHEIEIVDVFENPEQALEYGILLTPTLTVLSPAMTRPIVGDLSEIEVLTRALALEDEAS